MRKTVLSIIVAASLTACGGSGSSTLDGNTINGNFISTTVDVEQRFLYTLNQAEGSVSGFLIPSEEGGGHDHDHTHAKVLSQHDHGGEEGEEEGLELEELSASPFTFGGAAPTDMVVDGAGRTLFLLDAGGNLRANAIDGLTGQLTIGEPVPSNVVNPRFLRLSDSGDSMAVLGDSLAIFAIGENGVLEEASFLGGTDGWVDLRLQDNRGVGVTETGALGFLWSPGAQLDPGPEVPLPGGQRGQVAYAEAGVFVVNGQDVSVTQLAQDEDGFLTLVGTFALPDELTDPRTVTALFDGEDLLVGDSDSVVLLHPHEGELEEEGHADLDQTPTVLFAVPESAFVLAGHAAGEGFHAMEIGEDGITVLGEFETEYAGVSAFGYAERLERVTETVPF